MDWQATIHCQIQSNSLEPKRVTKFIIMEVVKSKLAYMSCITQQVSTKEAAISRFFYVCNLSIALAYQ